MPFSSYCLLILYLRNYDKSIINYDNNMPSNKFIWLFKSILWHFIAKPKAQIFKSTKWHCIFLTFGADLENPKFLTSAF